MNALRLVGVALLTAIAPCAIVMAGPAHADVQTCSTEGATLWGTTGPIKCTRTPDGQLQWVRVPAAAMCVAFCDRFGGP